jgi:hypothetical protein
MWFVICTLAALSFWSPIVLGYAVFGQDTSVLGINAVAMGATTACFLLLQRKSGLRNVGWWMLVGINLSGPILLQVAMSFIGGGFSMFFSAGDFWTLLTLSVPPMFWFTAGNGSVPSLFLISMILIYQAAREARAVNLGKYKQE